MNMKIVFYIFLINLSYFIISSKSYSINNCRTCGPSSGFGKELGRVIPKDPYFHHRNLVLSCIRNDGTKWYNYLSAYMNSSFVVA